MLLYFTPINVIIITHNVRYHLTVVIAWGEKSLHVIYTSQQLNYAKIKYRKQHNTFLRAFAINE